MSETKVSIVEKVARIIAEYPDEWPWSKANAEQRSHYEHLALRAIAAVEEQSPAAEAVSP
jgi:hypothetical protein